MGMMESGVGGLARVDHVGPGDHGLEAENFL